MRVAKNIIGAFAVDKAEIKDEKLFTDYGAEEANNVVAEDLAKANGVEVSEPRFLLRVMNSTKNLAKLREANIFHTRRRVASAVKIDQLIIQASNTIEDLDKISNMMAKRLREWYELYYPEVSHNIEDHEAFVRVILEKNRDDLAADEGQTNTMGGEVPEKDLDAVLMLARETQALYDLRQKELEYISKAMTKNYPNMTAVAGPTIASKLLALARSMQKIAMLPASTIQLLGAEKALFRHLTTGAKSPKYGVIINHPLVSKARRQDKGKIARVLADKISMAAKIDFFKGEFRGDDLRKQVEKRLKSLS